MKSLSAFNAYILYTYFWVLNTRVSIQWQHHKTMGFFYYHWLRLANIWEYTESARTFRCAFDESKCNFFRAFNVIFGKIGRNASAEVMVYLIKTKCLPVLLYCIEACPLNRHDKRSLDSSLTEFL